MNILIEKKVFIVCKKTAFQGKPRYLAVVMLTQRRKDVVRHYIKLRLGNVVTTLALRCHNVVTKSLFNVATTLSNDIGKNFHFERTNNVNTTNHPTCVTTLRQVFMFTGRGNKICFVVNTLHTPIYDPEVP